MYTATRRIEIDAAHRVPDHRSKCQSIHGHRYVIEATFETEGLITEGPESGMVRDFGFMKDMLIELIHTPCDHGLILSIHDPWLSQIVDDKDFVTDLITRVHNCGRACDIYRFGKLYVLPGPPTAEVLSRHWFDLVTKHMKDVSDESYNLRSMTVWETPNCFATFHNPR